MLTPRVPPSLLDTARTEHDDLTLDVVDGALPVDLRGHLFLVTPANTVSAAPGRLETTLMVGDGLVSRFDLSPTRIGVTSCFPQTPDLMADRITHGDPSLELFRFVSSGLVRVGLLGTRDFANTAFVPMPSPGAPTRMLLTYDAGRPIEIDPETLAYASPVGRRSEWRPEALPNAAFPVVLSPAHPAYDPRTRELFTVNYGRGVLNILETIPVVALLQAMPRWMARSFDVIATALGIDRAYHWLEARLARITTRVDRALEALLDEHLPRFVPDTFTDLIRWDGAGALERWRLVLPSGDEVSIAQSIHQVAVTRDHVVVLETGFKIGLQSGYDDPVPSGDLVERTVRAIVTRAQLPVTTLYVVPRAALRADAEVGEDGVRRVTCRAVTFPLESDHFVADYDDAGGRITVHLAHSPATDLSEWIRPYDVSAYDRAPIAPELHGMLAVGAMDVGRFGRYVIDAAEGEVLESHVLADEQTSWALALYAGAGLNTEAELPERIEQIYWCSEGCFPELLTEFVFELYEKYPHRLTSLDAILGMGEGGRPSAVHRIDTRTMTIADRFVLPEGTMAGSLQYVPRGDGPTDGYLVGTMYTPSRTELWIFDAADLAGGPRCRLAHPDLKLGFSLHTAWLPSVEARASSYAVPVADELRAAVARVPGAEALASAFEARLYPNLEP